MAESLEVRRATTSVSVDIYDQTYHLRASDQDYVQKLAAMVDGKLRAVCWTLYSTPNTGITIVFPSAPVSIPGSHLPISFADVSIHSETGLQSRCGS